MKSGFFRKESCKVQEMHKTVSGGASDWPPGILEDFVREGAISVYLTPVPVTSLAYVKTKAGINDVNFEKCVKTNMNIYIKCVILPKIISRKCELLCGEK
ncbi:MAG: hypothetical protein K5882_11335 [Bacteroidales bacterium]|nr:hypothetical protein [Bacteroidales bacterium]